MSRRVYLPGPAPHSSLAVLRGAVLAALCTLALAAFGHGFPLLLALLLGKV